MAVETHVHRARERVAAEREVVAGKREAFATFRDRVDEIPADGGPEGAGPVLAAGPPLHERSSTGGGCRAVREAFAKTVRPNSVADEDDAEPLLETLRAELTDAIALALAPTTETALTDELAAMIHSETASRQSEAALLERALEREAAQLASAERTIDEVTGWIVEADETPLRDLGFEGLRARHRRLSRHRERCGDLASERQSFLAATTGQGDDGAVGHRDLAEYCYASFPVDYPVLSTVATLVETCQHCQRAVRAHLVARG